MKKVSNFYNIPCKKCREKGVDVNASDKLKPDDKLMSGEFCPICKVTISAFFDIINWLNENFNKRRVCDFKFRNDGRFTEIKIGGCYIKMENKPQ
jgi:hypothetical protein